MEIIDLEGKKITVTDVDEALKQAQIFKAYRHADKAYRELDKKLLKNRQ